MSILTDLMLSENKFEVCLRIPLVAFFVVVVIELFPTPPPISCYFLNVLNILVIFFNKEIENP